MNVSVGLLVHYFGPDRNYSTTIRWTVIKLGSDIHSPQRMNPSNFSVFPILWFGLCPNSSKHQYV